MKLALAATAVSLALGLILPASAAPPFSSVHDDLSGVHAHQEDLANLLRESLDSRGLEGDSLSRAMACDGCHRPCSDCHRSGTGRFYYSARRASGNQPCLSCHAGWGAFPNPDGNSLAESAHFSGGMTCGSCHIGMVLPEKTASGHPAGLPLETTRSCESCHVAILGEAEHRIYLHGGRLACGACHAGTMVSLVDVDFGSLRGGETRVSTAVSGWIFLVNARNKVSPANIRTFRTEDGLRVNVFIPSSNHSVMPRGRACGDCHDTFAAREARHGCVKLTWREMGSLSNLARVIPVAEGPAYETDCRGDAPEEFGPERCGEDPINVFSGGCRPLRPDQLDRVATPRSFPAQTWFTDPSGGP